MRCGEKHRRHAGGESWWLWLNDVTIKKCSRAGRSLGHARDILRRRRNEKINLFLAPAQLILPVYQSRIISFTPQSQSTLFNHRLSNNNTTPPWNSSICYGHVHLWSLPSLLCPWVVMLRRERALPIHRTRSNMMVAVALLLNNALTPSRNLRRTSNRHSRRVLQLELVLKGSSSVWVAWWKIIQPRVALTSVLGPAAETIARENQMHAKASPDLSAGMDPVWGKIVSYCYLSFWSEDIQMTLRWFPWLLMSSCLSSMSQCRFWRRVCGLDKGCILCGVLW